MATNKRVTFVYEANPTFIWEAVEGAQFYALKLIRQSNPSMPLWEITKRQTDLKKDDSGYLKFEYPDHLHPLNELDAYVMMGETECESGKFTAQCEFILLESETRQAFEDLKGKVETFADEAIKESVGRYFNSQTMGPKLFKTSTGAAGWNIFRPCPTMQFSKQS